MQSSVHLTFRGQCEEPFRFYARSLGVVPFGIPWEISCEQAR
jgi:hypothetical protein